MLVGILQCGHFPETGNSVPRTYPDLYVRLLEGHGFTYRTWSVVDMEFPDSVQEADGWLISGSKHGAYEDHPFIQPLEVLIREIYGYGAPLVGICFGHQIIAQALGGQVAKHSSGWNCGPTAYQYYKAQMTLAAWHQDQVVELPTEAEVVGSSAMCKNAFIRYKGNAFSMQPHPEFDDDALRIVMNGPSRKLLSKEMLESVRMGLGTPSDSPEMAAEIARFFKGGGDTVN